MLCDGTLFIFSFIQQILAKHLLRADTCVQSGGHKDSYLTIKVLTL